MKNKLICFCLALLLLAAIPVTAAAQEFDPYQRGSISVTLVAKDNEASMEGAELSVFYVASVNYGSDGVLRYEYTEEFASCGTPLDDPDLAVKLEAYVRENSIDCRKIVTDEKGYAICQDLPLGLYFVKQTGRVEGFAPCTSFLVTIPMTGENGYEYQVDASPKTDVARLTAVTIKKVWNTGTTVGLPASVTVQLLQGEEVLDTAILNKQNNWQTVYEDMPVSDAYSIKELEVPKGYTATYSQKGYVFTVTNTPSLIQTGQMVWPIPVFALAGLVLLLVGFVILKKPEKNHA